ncbi:MAG: Uma2 family endonuclease [Fimbriimonadales bacterium]|nr:Uma2 family endonuclease [Fimbriimonadales bacterium]
MATAVQQIMSVDEFQRLYEGKRAELWRGEVREYMPSGSKHGIVAGRLTTHIGARLMNTREGEVFAKRYAYRRPGPAGI